MEVSELSKKIAQDYKQGKITGNEARRLCGLPPIMDPGMDVLVKVDDKTVDSGI